MTNANQTLQLLLLFMKQFGIPIILNSKICNPKDETKKHEIKSQRLKKNLFWIS